jgi:hypothetical protein
MLELNFLPHRKHFISPLQKKKKRVKDVYRNNRLLLPYFPISKTPWFVRLTFLTVLIPRRDETISKAV